MTTQVERQAVGAQFYTTLDLVLMAVIAVVFGIVNNFFGVFYQSLQAAGGPWLAELFAVFSIPAALAMFIIRQPGVALVTWLLHSVVQALAGNPDVKVEVGGHTDNTGSRATNTRLSQARAESVRNFLVQNGVNPDNVTAKGYGPDQPVGSNRTAAGRAQNRRVELKRLN